MTLSNDKNVRADIIKLDRLQPKVDYSKSSVYVAQRYITIVNCCNISQMWRDTTFSPGQTLPTPCSEVKHYKLLLKNRTSIDGGIGRELRISQDGHVGAEVVNGS